MENILVIINFLLLVVNSIMFCVSVRKLKISKTLLQTAKNIEYAKNKKREEYNTKLRNEFEELKNQKKILIQEIDGMEKQISVFKDLEQERMEIEISKNKKNFDLAMESYINNISKAYDCIEKEFDKKTNLLEKEKESIKNELDVLKQSLTAGVEAQLREREKTEALDFYKLNATDIEIKDILALENLKLSFRHPEILSKLIWTTFFQKQTTDMCNRILGTSKKTGIYKLTNIKTEQCYIGQSVDIATRWKAHVKCGLGIASPQSNKLYKAMQKDGVWNFTFELLEECPKELLNQKEKFWIELYQANNFGYNSTSGNK